MIAVAFKVLYQRDLDCRERRKEPSMRGVRLSLPTVIVLLAIVGAGAFAAGQSISSDPTSSLPAVPPTGTEAEEVTQPPVENENALPPGHPVDPSTGTAEPLPLGHPPVEPLDQARAQMQMANPDPASAAQGLLEWQLPGRWQTVANSSPFRLATCRIPRAAGDETDAELSITQAGGSVDANAERWIGQFDPAGQKTAKRTTRRVGGLDVTIVEVQGTYSGGMAKDASGGAGWALLGAIAATPGSPYFFKLTGPAKTVLASRHEFDQLVSSFAQR
ncbi:MAG: hypothetical protein M3O50_08985 [Myxococcota bacterium]|nr:hypothetical protein [Myxococcota bacterium]